MIPYTVDPETLDEVFADLDQVEHRIAELEPLVREGDHSREWFGLADEHIVLLLAVGRLDDALAHACSAVEWARRDPSLARVELKIAEARLAHVHSRRGEYLDATMSFLDLAGRTTTGGPTTPLDELRAEELVWYLAGRNDFAQRLWDDATGNFLRAICVGVVIDMSSRHKTAASEAAFAFHAGMGRLRASRS